MNFADVMKWSGQGSEAFRARFQDEEDERRRKILADVATAYYARPPLPEELRPTLRDLLDAYRATPAEIRAWARTSQDDRATWLACRVAQVPHAELSGLVESRLPEDVRGDARVEARRRALAEWREAERREVEAGHGASFPDQYHVGVAARGSGSRAVLWAGLDGAYDTAEAAMTELLWPSFKGNSFTAWGTASEPLAERWMFEQLCAMWRRAEEEGHPNPVAEAWIENRGFQAVADAPYLGCSVDGILYVVFRDGSRLRYVVEYKCPAAVNRETGKRHVYSSLYVGYVAQAIFNCAVTEGDGDDTPLADVMIFCVWTPDEQRIDFLHWRDHDNAATIVSRMTEYFFEHYAPLVLLREARMLIPGTLWLKPGTRPSQPGRHEDGEQREDVAAAVGACAQ